MKVIRASAADPDPYWIWIQSGQWIRIQSGQWIRIHIDGHKVEKNKKYHFLKCWMFSLES
jgi:hypothetical protein